MHIEVRLADKMRNKKYTLKEDIGYTFILLGLIIGLLCFIFWYIDWWIVRLWVGLSILIGIALNSSDRTL